MVNNPYSVNTNAGNYNTNTRWSSPDEPTKQSTTKEQLVGSGHLTTSSVEVQKERPVDTISERSSVSGREDDSPPKPDTYSSRSTESEEGTCFDNVTTSEVTYSNLSGDVTTTVNETRVVTQVNEIHHTSSVRQDSTHSSTNSNHSTGETKHIEQHHIDSRRSSSSSSSSNSSTKEEVDVPVPSEYVIERTDDAEQVNVPVLPVPMGSEDVIERRDDAEQVTVLPVPIGSEDGIDRADDAEQVTVLPVPIRSEDVTDRRDDDEQVNALEMHDVADDYAVIGQVPDHRDNSTNKVVTVTEETVVGQLPEHGDNSTNKVVTVTEETVVEEDGTTSYYTVTKEVIVTHSYTDAEDTVQNADVNAAADVTSDGVAEIVQAPEDDVYHVRREVYHYSSVEEGGEHGSESPTEHTAHVDVSSEEQRQNWENERNTADFFSGTDVSDDIIDNHDTSNDTPAMLIY